MVKILISMYKSETMVSLDNNVKCYITEKIQVGGLFHWYTFIFKGLHQHNILHVY